MKRKKGNPVSKNQKKEKIPTPQKQEVSFFLQHKEKIVIISLALLFIIIGSFGLGKFFTTDETAWYYNWIHKYWEAYLSGNFIDTNLTTYPGALHSFLCGSTNLFLDQTEYMTFDKVETYLFWWRFPILLFNAISLIGIFYLLKNFFSQIQSLVIVFVMMFSPYLIGMSRIVNPDSLLWSTSLISILSYIVFVREQKTKYLILAGVFMGMALASKYNAVLLFVFFPITLISEFIFGKINHENLKKLSYKTLIIWLIALAVFSVFLPAVFVKPIIYYGRVFQYFVTNPIFIALVVLIITDTYLLKNKTLSFLKEKILLRKRLIQILPILFLFLIIISLLIRAFDIQFASWNVPNEQWKIPFTKALYLNIFEYFTSQQIAIVAGFIVFAIISLFSKRKDADFSIPILMLIFILIFIAGATLKGVRGSGHRYGIMLYPFAIIITIWTFSFFKKKHIIFGIIALLSVIELGFVFPKYYISYQNKRYFTTGQKLNVWAIGGYDLAQEMNKLPNASKVKVYADRYSFKHFFKGYTENITTDTKASKLKQFDYLCLSKAGFSQVPMSPPLKYYYDMPQDSFEYFVGDKNNYWMGLIKVDKNKKELKIPNTFDPEYYIDLSKNWAVTFWVKPYIEDAGKMLYIGKDYNTGFSFEIKKNKFICKINKDKTIETETLIKNKLNSIMLISQIIDKEHFFKILLNGKEISSSKIDKKTSEKLFLSLNFKGEINDVRIFNRTLSSSEINAIYNMGEMVLERKLKTSEGKFFEPKQYFTHKTK